MKADMILSHSMETEIGYAKSKYSGNDYTFSWFKIVLRWRAIVEIIIAKLKNPDIVLETILIFSS